MGAYSSDDTIVAIATPAGRGALGVVRIDGPAARQIAQGLLRRTSPLEPRYATHARIRAAAGLEDEVVVTYFQAPKSYTGQDLVEISAHGSPVVLRAIVEAAIRGGARLARPGEFTLRGFLNGKRDLVQAEAVADLIASETPQQARLAFDQLHGTLTGHLAAFDRRLFDLTVVLEASLDFPEEGYHFIELANASAAITEVIEAIDLLLAGARTGRMIREGAHVVIAGRPNVGKSQLFNALAGSDRSIVTPQAGTTRDLVSEGVDVGGVRVQLVDTAGVRDSADVVEREGVSRAGRARLTADLVVLVLDGSEALTSVDDTLLRETHSQNRVVVVNKMDRPSAWERPHDEWIPVSALEARGVDVLRQAMAEALTGAESAREDVLVSNVRHVELLGRAGDHLRHAREALDAGTPEEFVLSDLQAARACFEEVVGTRTSEELLESIFTRFCIGK